MPCLELTPEEQQAYQERLAAAKAQLAPARVAAVQAAVEAADPDRPPSEVAAIVEQSARTAMNTA